jgi:hypothetical protein
VRRMREPAIRLRITGLRCAGRGGPEGCEPDAIREAARKLGVSTTVLHRTLQRVPEVPLEGGLLRTAIVGLFEDNGAGDRGVPAFQKRAL